MDKYWIGVDLGGTNIRVGLLSDTEAIVSEEKELTEAYLGPDAIVNKLKNMISSVRTDHKIQGIGIGMPGPLDPYSGIVLSPVNLPGWDNVPLARIITEYFEVPCFIENDCNVAALAESLIGAGKGYPIVFYITVSTGIGGGLCVSGEIFSGSTGNAGEIANIIVRENTVKHSFLNPGSMESMASGTGVMRMALEKGLPVRHAHEVFTLAEEGNLVACEITEIVIDSLSRGMAAIAHVVDPHIFVLGGGVSISVPDFVEKVRKKFEQYIYRIMRGRICIKLAQLPDPGILGAVFMAKKRIKKIQ